MRSVIHKSRVYHYPSSFSREVSKGDPSISICRLRIRNFHTWTTVSSSRNVHSVGSWGTAEQFQLLLLTIIRKTRSPVHFIILRGTPDISASGKRCSVDRNPLTTLHQISTQPFPRHWHIYRPQDQGATWLWIFNTFPQSITEIR